MHLAQRSESPRRRPLRLCRPLVDESIAAGMMGRMFFVYAIPVLAIAGA